jgi:hypothetical protein
MAYSAFSKTTHKFGFLCYPSHQLELKKVIFKNIINEVTNTIIVCGFPLKKSCIGEAKKYLSIQLNNLCVQYH